MEKKILLFFANGTEEVEALVPCDFLRRCGGNVTLCAVGTNDKLATGSHGIKVECDVLESELDKDSSYDMVIVPGGLKGAQTLSNSDTVEYFLAKAQIEGKFIASICASPALVLGKFNLLLGRCAVCYPGFESDMKGAIQSNEKVVRDENLITAKGAGVSVEFALELAKALYGNEKSEELARKVVWK